MSLIPFPTGAPRRRGGRIALCAAGSALLAGTALVSGAAGASAASSAKPADTTVPALLYASSPQSGQIDVIGLSSNTVVNAFGHAGFNDMVASPAGDLIWGTIAATAGEIRGVSTANFHPTGGTFLGGTQATSIGVSADGTYVYALVPADAEIAVFDTATEAVTLYPVPESGGAQPQDLAVDGVDEIGYVTDSAGTVTGIDLTTGDVLGQVSVGASAASAVLSVSDRYLYVEDQAAVDGKVRVAVVDTVRYQVDAQIAAAAGNEPGPLAISADGSLLFAGDPENGTVHELDTTALKATATIHLPSGDEPTGLIADSDDLFIGTSPNLNVVVYSLPQKKTIAKIDLSADLSGTAVTEFTLGPAVAGS